MLKKLLILLSICFMAFTACKKQPAENTENKTVLVYKDDEPVELELRDIGIIYQQMKELR